MEEHMKAQLDARTQEWLELPQAVRDQLVANAKAAKEWAEEHTVALEDALDDFNYVGSRHHY
jgi:hypothetical protein